MQIFFFIAIAVLLFIIYILSSMEEKRLKDRYEPRGKVEEYCFFNGSERRRCQRVEAKIDVKYRLLKSSGLNLAHSSKNISEVGIGILIYEILPVNTLMELEIAVPSDKNPLIIKGRVAWCDSSEQMDKDGRRVFLTGIEFIDADTKQKDILTKCISSRLLYRKNAGFCGGSNSNEKKL